MLSAIVIDCNRLNYVLISYLRHGSKEIPGNRMWSRTQPQPNCAEDLPSSTAMAGTTDYTAITETAMLTLVADQQTSKQQQK